MNILIMEQIKNKIILYIEKYPLNLKGKSGNKYEEN